MSVTNIHAQCNNVDCPRGNCSAFTNDASNNAHNCAYCGCHQSAHELIGLLLPDGTYVNRESAKGVPKSAGIPDGFPKMQDRHMCHQERLKAFQSPKPPNGSSSAASSMPVEDLTNSDVEGPPSKKAKAKRGPKGKTIYTTMRDKTPPD